MHGAQKKYIQHFGEKKKTFTRDYLEDPGVDGRITINRPGFSWFHIQTGGRIL